MGDLERDAAGIGALADPVRRELYLHVCAQPAPVSRDQAADAVGVARHQAKFHLDRLEAEGLLEADYARLTGRTGPGAGRTAKRYRRSPHEVAVSLPDREYALAGHLMAEAIAESARADVPVLDALRQAADAHGRGIGGCISSAGRGKEAMGGDALDLALRVLAENGYEPRRDGDGAIMANCPFHALAQTHTELVCRMNLALIAGLIDTVGRHRLDARLEPAADRCCVVLSPVDDGSSPSSTGSSPSSTGSSPSSTGSRT
jgi:predicted ArsR family transcriptional regulator